MLLIIVSWIATTCSIVGNIGVNFKKYWGMQVWFIGSLIWIYYAWQTKNYAQLIMFIFYSLLNIQGLYLWSKFKGGNFNEQNSKT